MDKSKWEYKKLGDVCAPKNDILRANKLFGKDDMIEYIDISSIDNSAYCITQPTSYLFHEAPSRAQQKVEKGDILYSLVRPNLKNIAAVTSSNTEKYVASSGFCVLRSKNIDNRYLYHLVLSNPFTDYILGLVSGANYPAVREDDVKGFSFKCPPLEDQQRIVAELDCLNEMIAVKQEQLKEFDKLAQSIFYDMFGDPVSNEKGWNHCLLKDVSLTITDGDHMPPPKSESGVPFVTISNVDKDTRQIDFSSTYFVPREYYDNIPESKKPQVGDVLYTVTGSYGIPILIRENKEFCFQRHIGLIRPNKDVEPIFLCMWAGCQSVKKHADRYATGVAQKTVSLKVLRNFPMIVPPLALQQQFADKISAIEAQKELVKQSIAETQYLFNSRMDYYFN